MCVKHVLKSVSVDFPLRSFPVIKIEIPGHVTYFVLWNQLFVSAASAGKAPATFVDLTSNVE